MSTCRLDGANTIGKDLDGDGLPDMALRYEMDEGSVVEFPLNFCPGKNFKYENLTTGSKETQKHVTPNHLTSPCVGKFISRS